MEITQFWSQGDAVTHAVTLLLVFLSLVSWAVIGARFVTQIKLNRAIERGLDAFWGAQNLDAAVAAIRATDATRVLSGMAETAALLMQAHRRQATAGIGAGTTASDMLTRGLRNYMVHAQARLESGLTFLASVGSTAPFIGLFGTVWGIYHALVSLSGATQVVLDKVAGPVGEALIMTAGGLFVAIPAVLAYNALTRANRLVVAYLDGFAHDLHAYLTTGARVTLAQAA